MNRDAAFYLHTEVHDVSKEETSVFSERKKLLYCTWLATSPHLRHAPRTQDGNCSHMKKIKILYLNSFRRRLVHSSTHYK